MNDEDKLKKFLDELIEQIDSDIEELKNYIKKEEIVPESISRRQAEVDWYAERFNLN